MVGRFAARGTYFSRVLLLGWTPLALALRWVVGVCSRVFPHTQAVGPVGLRVVGKNIFRKNLRAASQRSPPRRGGAQQPCNAEAGPANGTEPTGADSFVFRIIMEPRWPAGDFGALIATSVVVGLCVLLWARRWRDDDAARRGNASSAVTIVQLPTEAQPYKRLPAEGTFTRQNIPKGLLGKHNTKAGVYGKINVTCGVLQLETLDGALETVTITAGHHAIVAPRQYHTVTPLSDDVEMYIEFHAKPNDDVKGGGFG